MNIGIVDSDDDTPPELVEAGSYVLSQEGGGGGGGGAGGEVEKEASPARRVPITIVTGTANQNSSPLQPAQRQLFKGDSN